MEVEVNVVLSVAVVDSTLVEVVEPIVLSALVESVTRGLVVEVSVLDEPVTLICVTVENSLETELVEIELDSVVKMLVDVEPVVVESVIVTVVGEEVEVSNKVEREASSVLVNSVTVVSVEVDSKLEVVVTITSVNSVEESVSPVVSELGVNESVEPEANELVSIEIVLVDVNPVVESVISALEEATELVESVEIEGSVDKTSVFVDSPVVLDAKSGVDSVNSGIVVARVVFSTSLDDVLISTVD